jgi:hypothetical protein
MRYTATVPQSCPLCEEATIVEVLATTGESVVCCDNPECPWTWNDPADLLE